MADMLRRTTDLPSQPRVAAIYFHAISIANRHWRGRHGVYKIGARARHFTRFELPSPVGVCPPAPPAGMVVAILNHALPEQALTLKRVLSAHARTVAIDSGSSLTPEQHSGFDLALPNVYYSGLLNAVAELTESLPPDDPVFFWCSDVSCADYGRACALAREAFTQPHIGIYAPSSWHSDQPQMRNRSPGGLRRVTFVDGFCFATRASILHQLCPIDTRLNRRGWGLEVQLGYIARHNGWHVVVDDRLEVRHPHNTGYCRETAWRERGQWQAALPPIPRLFHRLARRPLAKRSLTMRLMLALPW